MKQKILIVDDEEKILQSLRRLFRTSDYDFKFCQSGKEGLELLRTEPVSVIISDMQMPEMNGVEFLEQATEICPDAIRMILSGYSEADRIMDAINKGQIWRFISKPWNNDDIKVTVANAVDLYQKNRERIELTEKLRRKTDELDELNKTLEKKVAQRTWHLNERTRLLNMLLEDADIDTVLKQSCLSVSKLLGGAAVCIRTFLNDKYYTSENTGCPGIPEDFIRAEKKMLESGSSLVIGDITAVMLSKSGQRLGVLLIDGKNMSRNINIEKNVEGFISLLDIALFQFKSLESTPELIQNIDKIIGSI